MKKLLIMTGSVMGAIIALLAVNVIITPTIDSIDAEAALIKENGIYANEVKRMEDGTYMIAARTEMPGVTSDMVRWWFAEYMQTTDHYKSWHPTAHVWMDWENKKPGEVIGASHLVHEYIGDTLFKLRIQFVDPALFFGHDPNDENTFVICAHNGDLETPIYLGKMCHIVVNTPTGAEMRSRFWLGHIASREGNEAVPSLIGLLGNSYLPRYAGLSETGARDLMIHAQEEMSILAKMLPAIYSN